MSIPPNSPWRGAAAAYPQPIGEVERLALEALVSMVYYVNCQLLENEPLDDIIYRSSDDDLDVRRHVFRWDLTSYEEVFANGFDARREGDTPATTYFNLDDFIHNTGRPLQIARPATHAFISTTLDASWRPDPPMNPPVSRVYRYEIYAPGGIWVEQTLGARYQYPNQREITFIGAIAPQYIRAVQEYRIELPHGSRFPRLVRVDDRLICNDNFSPQSHPYCTVPLQRPVTYYVESGVYKKLMKKVHRPQQSDHEREGRLVSNDPVDWYTKGVEDIPIYINAAFRARATNEAYLFMKNEYVLVNYAPGSTNDRIINGPLLICDGYPSLAGTAFGEYGIDCAFDTDGTEAFIFSDKLCAYIDYAPGTTNDKILQGPMIIAAMFPFFKGTVFENGIDAAFRATARNEAYLFKGDQYALINYSSKTQIAIRPINQGFHSFKETTFERGIEAAFASHRTNEAYIFKDDQYALINFAPGSTNDYIIGGVKKIVDHWPSLGQILPLENRGLDQHDNHD